MGARLVEDLDFYFALEPLDLAENLMVRTQLSAFVFLGCDRHQVAQG